MKFYVFIIAVLLFNVGKTQNNTTNWRLFEDHSKDEQGIREKNAYLLDTLKSTEINDYKLSYNKTPGVFTVYEDPKIKELSRYVGKPHGRETEVKIEGFRVQIFFDQNREKVERAEKEFKRKHGKVKTYLDFDNPPIHRLRVGNYRTKLEALKFQDKIKGAYPNAMIVKKVLIELPELE